MQEFFTFILWPVSAVLWAWHKVFSLVLPANSGVSWALSIFFLVFTLRLALIKPALSQLRSGRRMQKFAPQMQKIREKHKNDRQKMAEEMRKLQSEHGVNPVGGCLPAVLQLPVFLSLVTVLRDFTTPGRTTVFIFGPQDVQSFINAHIFGAKLGNHITDAADRLAQFGTDRTSMMVVGIPLMIISSVATFFTMRLSVNRQGGAAMGGSAQSAMIGKAMMYLAPLGLLVSGAFWPLGLLLYFLANNIWTLGQQHFLTTKIDREEQRQKEREIAAKKEAPRPKPGQKPVRNTEKGKKQGQNQKSEQVEKAGEGHDGEPESSDEPTTSASSAVSPEDVGTNGDKPTTGASSKGKSGGNKSGGNKSGGNKSAKSGASADAGKTSDGKTSDGKTGGGKTGGGKSNGAKAGGAKSGSANGQSSSSKSSGNSASESSSSANKAASDKAGTDRTGSNRAGTNASSGDKSSAAKSGGKKAQQKNRPGKQATAARKSQKKRR